MMKRLLIVGVAISAFIPFSAKGAEAEIKTSFNARNVILPSSQYTPASPYEALVWVVKGDRYSDENYNKILSAPSADNTGKEWYEPEYNPSEVSSGEWTTQKAPFSSDATYLGQKSYQWAAAEMMGEMYMRRSFTLTPDELLYKEVYLAMGHDDAPAEWYINGVKVASASDGWNNDEYILLTAEQKDLIKTDGSENILAVHVHQNWGGAFADCGLYGADMSMVQAFLPTLDDGAWPCSYYFLNYNNDFADAEKAEWYSTTENESDWIKGVGPFSNSDDMFLTTEWASQLRPILIRRHFNLSAEDLAIIGDSQLTFSCSYDEEPIAYLNGEKFWSRTGWNDNNYDKTILTDKQKNLLVEGDNILAVSLRQGGGGGHVDFGLLIEGKIDNMNPSAVGTVKNEKISDNKIYNLQGQYLGTSAETLAPGIYIRNGKKIIIK